MTGRQKNMYLRPSARLQKYLGRELIADPNLAIIEFVKNSYDAGASEVSLSFHIASGDFLLISDDGLGMDESAFRANWLSPGFSAKSPEYSGPELIAKDADHVVAGRARGREPAGEKGLGRLASGRLGDVMEVWTRPTPASPWLHVVFDWDEFDNMGTYMDQVPIPFDDEQPDEPKYQAGTIVKISSLRQNWGGKVPGRPSPGRKRTRLGRLKQDLELLIRPFGGQDPNFTVHLDSDVLIDADDIGTIQAVPSTRTADYVYSFSIRAADNNIPIVERSLQRSKALAAELELPEADDYSDDPNHILEDRAKSYPDSLRCGPFEGTFYYSPPPAARRAKTIEGSAIGVLLYRDGVLVEPYGLPGDDWVGAEARKASRQGHAAIQPANFSGYVTISRTLNPKLEEMSNRLGLLETEASEDFFGIVREEFAIFEDLVYNEVLLSRWTSIDEKASKQAVVASHLAEIRTRAIAHSLGQPLAAIAFEILRLKVLRRRDDIPEEVKSLLQDIQDRVEGHLDRITSTVRTFADMQAPTVKVHELQELIAPAVDDAMPLAELSGVALITAEVPSIHCLVPGELVVEAFAELIKNAIEIERDSTVQPWVRVVVARSADGRQVEVRIVDNGIGFEEGIPSNLHDVTPTHGRPSEGLAIVENAISVSRGTVHVESTGQDGTVMLVQLPAIRE